MRSAPLSLIALSLVLGAAPGCLIEAPGLRGADCAEGECDDGLVCVDKRCVAPVLDAGPDVPPLPEDWHDPDYAHRSRVVIDNSGVNSALVGVPVAVRIDNAHPGFEDVRAGGIAFYSDDGDLLPHEFEFANVANARLWVRPDFIPASTEPNAGLWMYFRGPGAPEDPSGLWQDYIAVWHLGDPVNDTRYPASATSLNLSDLNAVAEVNRTGGVVGNGVRLEDGAYLQGSREASLHAGAGQRRTYSLWASLRNTDIERTLFRKASFDGTCFGPYIETVGLSRLRAGYRSGTCDPNDPSDPHVDSALDLLQTETLDTSFHLYALVVDQSAGVMRFFIDGTQQGFANLPAVDTGAFAEQALLTIGALVEPDNDVVTPWFGFVDEVRVSERASTAAELTFRARVEAVGMPVDRAVENRDGG